MKSQTEKPLMTTHLFPNISRRKSDQTVKFSQLIEYSIRNIFLEKLYIKCGGKLVTYSSIKSQNRAYL